MNRMMKWILWACVLFLVTPEMLPAQEQASQEQRAQSVEQSKGNVVQQQQQIQQHLMQLEKQRNEQEIKQMEAREKYVKYYNTLAFFSFVIAVLGVLAIIALIFFTRARKERRRHELIGLYLEKGQEVPRELLAERIAGTALSSEQWAAFTRARDLRWGTWLLCLGLGIGLAIYLWSGNLRYTVWCLIILFLSAGFYINALFLSGQSDVKRNRESDT